MGWLDRKRNWLPPRRREPAAAGSSPKPKAENPKPSIPPELPGVIYRPLRCPGCRSKDAPVYSTTNERTRVIRYHRCRKCGRTFKSVEDKQPQDG
ncbi:MAG TPA: hypothetical protein VM223_13410 [Planctomycetota bacterium]|nr:hypothetical protein [Planctomycetota bacterium]